MAIVFLVLTVGVYFGAVFYKQGVVTSLASIDSQLADLERSRDKQVEKNLLGLRDQLSVVNPLLSAHLFWSNALIVIQGVTQPQVQYKSINADVSGEKITAIVLAANYTAIARQIAALYTVDSVTDVLLNKVQSQPTGRLGVTFQIYFDTDKFLIKGTK